MRNSSVPRRNTDRQCYLKFRTHFHPYDKAVTKNSKTSGSGEDGGSVAEVTVKTIISGPTLRRRKRMARRGSYAMATEDALLVDEFNVAPYALGPRVGGPSRLMRQQLGPC